jgi:hypothetical protein
MEHERGAFKVNHEMKVGSVDQNAKQPRLRRD